MREKYSEFYPPTEEDFQQLWDESHFVFDANTLLNLYMYTEETVDDFWKVFENIEDRIWISFQAGYEFHKHRPSRIRTQQVLFEQTIKSLADISTNAQNSLKNTFQNIREHPSIKEKKILKEVSGFFDSLIERVQNKKDKYPDWLKEDDKILAKVSDLFEGKVGEKFPDEELEKIYEEGEKRYNEEVPPGFEDANEKDGVSKFGDLIIWKEILRFATRNEVKSVIFVTDDSKSDWWRFASGRTVSPHPHLIKEFKEETNKDYYQYNSEQFLKFAKDNLIDVSEESISETKRVSEESRNTKTIRVSQEELKNMRDRFNTFPNISREQLDQIMGVKRLSEIAHKYLQQANLLPNISQEQLDQITGIKRLSEIARQNIQQDSHLRNLPDKDSGSQEKIDSSEEE